MESREVREEGVVGSIPNRCFEVNTDTFFLGNSCRGGGVLSGGNPLGERGIESEYGDLLQIGPGI